MNRRSFFKFLGIVAATISTGSFVERIFKPTYERYFCSYCGKYFRYNKKYQTDAWGQRCSPEKGEQVIDCCSFVILDKEFPMHVVIGEWGSNNNRRHEVRKLDNGDYRVWRVK
jgi:hypothetical protein